MSFEYHWSPTCLSCDLAYTPIAIHMPFTSLKSLPSIPARSKAMLKIYQPPGTNTTLQLHPITNTSIAAITASAKVVASAEGPLVTPLNGVAGADLTVHVQGDGKPYGQMLMYLSVQEGGAPAATLASEVLVSEYLYR